MTFQVIAAAALIALSASNLLLIVRVRKLERRFALLYRTITRPRHQQKQEARSFTISETDKAQASFY